MSVCLTFRNALHADERDAVGLDFQDELNQILAPEPENEDQQQQLEIRQANLLQNFDGDVTELLNMVSKKDRKRLLKQFAKNLQEEGRGEEKSSSSGSDSDSDSGRERKKKRKKKHKKKEHKKKSHKKRRKER